MQTNFDEDSLISQYLLCSFFFSTPFLLPETFDPGSPSKFALRQALVPSLGLPHKVGFWLVRAATKTSGSVYLRAKQKLKDVSIL